MTVLDILGSVATGIFSGGATGVIGMIAQRIADYKNKQLDIQLEAQRAANKLAELQAQAAIMKEEWAGRTQVAIEEGKAASDVADAQAFAKSFDLEPKKFSGESLTAGQQWVMVMLDAFRGSVRPMLTLYLCILVTLIYVEARRKLSAEDLQPDQALELFKLMLGTICYVWTTITLWWFGTRNKVKQPGA